MKKPIIGITMGDPAGIGPEITAKLLSSDQQNKTCQTFVIGDAEILRQRMDLFKIKGKIRIISAPDEVSNKANEINCLDLKNINIKDFEIGKVQEECGRASVEYIQKAVKYLKKNEIQAMVTCPINKEAMNKAGFLYAGHTEMLARLTGTRKYAMMLAGEKLRVVLVTTHIAVNKVSQNITAEKVFEKIKLTNDFLVKYFAIKKPEIAVCGLNPHNGEAGLFGNEEDKEIIPAIEKAKKKKMNISGPYPADTLFFRAKDGVFDAVIVMYHDQGLIPLKMLYMDSGVNITIGLPIIRTSVDHGTAFDIAHKGTASPISLNEAVKIAADMARNQ